MIEGQSAAQDRAGTAPPPGGVGLLINAMARSGAREVSAISAALARHGLALDHVARVRRPRALAHAAEALLARGIGRLLIGGGDGTISTVAPLLAQRDVLMGVIPLGTANDFARTLNIPARLDRAAAVAAGSHWRPIDLGRANDVYFLNVAGIGLGSNVTRALIHRPRLKRWLGPASYAVAGVGAFFNGRGFRVEIATPAGNSTGLVHQVVVGNGRFYGGGTLVDNRSTLDDGVMAIYTLGSRSRWQMLRTVTLLKFRVPLDRPGDIFLRTPSAWIVATPPQPVSLDGEIRTVTPVTFTVESAALKVLTPAGP